MRIVLLVGEEAVKDSPCLSFFFMFLFLLVFCRASATGTYLSIGRRKDEGMDDG